MSDLSAQAAALPAVQKFEVTPLELLFDLVFVFAVSQLSHHLLEHLSWHGALEWVILLLAVYRTWSTTSWNVAMLGVNQRDSRAMLLVCMFLGLFMNAAIPEAFGAQRWAFVWPLIIGMVGRAVWMALRAPLPIFTEHFFRTSIWMIGLALLWLWGGLLDAQGRLWVWTLAVAIDFIGAWTSHPLPGRRFNTENLVFDADHMLERNRLFLLIALGETIMTTGAAIDARPLNTMTLVTGTAALAATVALWAILFGRIHEITLGIMEHTTNPVQTGRTATNNQVFIVAGLILLAVGNERVIDEPQAAPSLALSLLLFGGPLLVQVALAFFLWLMQKRFYPRQLVACGLLFLAGVLTLSAPPYIALSVAAVLLVGLALWER